MLEFKSKETHSSQDKSREKEDGENQRYKSKGNISAQTTWFSFFQTWSNWKILKKRFKACDGGIVFLRNMRSTKEKFKKRHKSRSRLGKKSRATRHHQNRQPPGWLRHHYSFFFFTKQREILFLFLVSVFLIISREKFRPNFLWYGREVERERESCWQDKTRSVWHGNTFAPRPPRAAAAAFIFCFYLCSHSLWVASPLAPAFDSSLIIRVLSYGIYLFKSIRSCRFVDSCFFISLPWSFI